MPLASENPVSSLASALPQNALVVILGVGIITMIVHYMSPLHLTIHLKAAIDHAWEAYIEAHEMGLVSANETETLHLLQLQVFSISEETLRNSLSRWAALHDFLRGRTFVLLRCICEVRTFEMHMKILKESHLRNESNLNPRAVFLRRRGVGAGGNHSRRLA
ncbi:hypothetical protein MVEN_02650200 [Mycena venus]|uniref:Uncharacterized protein n=1 Tax=Mycena venus TaxID=2733690 RepID=A0A8H6TWZ0_9AGAR|nr:hypothetical protein MVEN_02650200 [Mycena venus]